jgi:hypothetical protein
MDADASRAAAKHARRTHDGHGQAADGSRGRMER